MSGTRSASGLQCSHGSELDTKIPRPKMPRTALPPELRKSMGLKPRTENDENDAVIWKVESHQLWFNCTLRHAVLQAGSGVLAPTGSAPDGTFLKRGSGAAMSQRASALAQKQMVARNRAHVLKARLVDSNGNEIVANHSDDPINRNRRRSSGAEDMKKACVSESRRK